jgi:hypothetical protein
VNCLYWFKLSAFAWMEQSGGLGIIANAGGNEMTEYSEEVVEQEMVTLDKVFMGFLIGIVAILSAWFLGGLLYVILK